MMKNLVASVLVMLALNALLYTSSALGANIDPNGEGQKYSYSENVGWVNFAPSQGGGVTVDDDRLLGYVWAENIGWLKLDPQFGGVVNDGRGNLSGYAWSENVGWINFSCTTNDTCSEVDYGVRIDLETGIFSGDAWGENIGWIRFDYLGIVNPSETYVKTFWRLNGDLSSDGMVSLEDAVLGLQVMAGIVSLPEIHVGGDVDGNQRIGLAEVIMITREVAGVEQVQ